MQLSFSFFLIFFYLNGCLRSLGLGDDSDDTPLARGIKISFRSFQIRLRVIIRYVLRLERRSGQRGSNTCTEELL
ncbi:hypothetical protein V8C43DRAFT_269806, partial [Trichoderma afarasin]